MAIETLVGLQVVDDKGYQSYRDEMTPILERYGGGFGYDFKIAEVLKSQTTAPINRVFTISFPDQSARDAFFSNEDYLHIRQRHFENAVTHTTIMASYQL